MKLQLRGQKPYPAHYRRNILPWSSCSPFVENTRGVLVHRPRAVNTVMLLGKSHVAIKYWCGNGVSGRSNLTFLDRVPDNVLLCEACERNACAANLPSAAAIVGRHVHLGKVKAVQTCCEAVDEEFVPSDMAEGRV